MWIFLNDAALSIVADRNNSANLLVRARVPGDIEAVFPEAQVTKTPDADYRYRAFVGRGEVADAIANRVAAIDYDNFKDSASAVDGARGHAYHPVWVSWHSWAIWLRELVEGRATTASRRSPH